MASDLIVPHSPGSYFTADEGVVDGESNGLHLELAPFGLEHIYDYGPDGHHPVQLGNAYGSNGRYRVIHKLGNRGFATVWLCRDNKAKVATKYMALKILMAEISNGDCPKLRVDQLKYALSQDINEGNGREFICLPPDHFKIHGPNGDHICFVYPVLGSNVSLGLFRVSADLDNDLRSLGLQVSNFFIAREYVIAVSRTSSNPFFLCWNAVNPNKGLDITPNNVPHRITGLEGLNEDEVLKILGSPVVNHVLNASQERHHGPTAPDYLVYPVDWCDVDTQLISKDACLIDFGESFEISQSPDDLGTPGPYRSPELILNEKASFGSDIWALGCSLFEIRTGRKLFSPFDDENNEYLDAFVQVLGRLPEPWWSTTLED